MKQDYKEELAYNKSYLQNRMEDLIKICNRQPSVESFVEPPIQQVQIFGNSR